MPNADPLTQIYAALWSNLEAHPGFDGMVKPANTVHFDADKPSLARPRQVVQAADLPELVLTYEGFNGNIRSTSDSSTFVVRWAWILTTGDMRMDTILLPLSWIITESLVRAHPELMTLERDGYKFIKKVELVDVRAGESEILRRSNIRGWSTVQSLSTTIILPTNQMVANATA